jgi:hypothetical protein
MWGSFKGIAFRGGLEHGNDRGTTFVAGESCPVPDASVLKNVAWTYSCSASLCPRSWASSPGREKNTAAQERPDVVLQGMGGTELCATHTSAYLSCH